MINIVRNIQGKTFEFNIDKLIEAGYNIDNAKKYIDTYIEFVLSEKDISLFNGDKINIVL